MTQITASTEGRGHPLVARIGRLRGRVRLVLGLFGAGLLVATAVAGFLLLVAGDFCFHFSLQTRVVLLIAGGGVLAGLAYRKLVLPLSTKLTDQFLASRVENVNKDLADELISAVHFVKSGTVLSNALAARHVDAASAKASGLRFEDAIDFRMARRSVGAAIGLVLLMTVLAVLNPGLTRVVFGRFLALDRDAAWPRMTTVQFVWGTPDGKAPAVLPNGEQFTVQAKVVRGGYESQRVWLSSYSDAQPKTARELMTFQKEQSGKGVYLYERALDPVGNPVGSGALYVWLEAGDQTDMEPVRIRLAPRPVVGELSAAITPPAYVKGAPAVVVNLLQQAGRAVEGSRVALRIKTSKPLMVDEQGRPDVRFFDQSKDVEVPLADVSRKLLEPNVAEVSFTARQPLQVRAMVRDTDGFENRVGGTMSLEVVPDGLPSVVIIDPRRAVERSPGATVEIVGQGTDDLGLDGAKLVAEKFDAKPGDPPVFAVDLKWSKMTTDTAAGSTTGKLGYTWDLAGLKLEPGARLSFYLMVQDNYEVKSAGGAVARPFVISEQGTVRHEWVKSAPLVLQIRSEAEIAEKSRRDLNEIKERIVNLKKQQEETKAKTDAINKAVSDSGVSTPQQKEQLGDLAQQQSQQAASANAIQQRVEQIRQDLQQNKMQATDLGKLATEVSAGMKDVGQNNMPKAASELSKAQEAAGASKAEPTPAPPGSDKAEAKQKAEQTKDATGSAGKQQQEAITTMDNMIEKLGAAGDFEAIRQKTREILDQQTKLAKETRETMAPNVGKKPEELAKEAKEKEDALAGKQKSLADQTAALTEQMDKTARQTAASDPATSESLTKAAEASKSNDVSGGQSSASKSVSKNNLSNASNSQQQAQRGLQQMLDELDKQSQRQLEQLSRQLADLLDDLKKRLKEENQINKETTDLGEKGDKKAFLTLGDQQGRTHQNTIVNQKKAESTRDAQKAAADVRDAADAMGNAAGALYAAKGANALEPEVAAVKSLEEAIRKLEEQKKKVDNQLKEKDLAEFIRQYEGIRKGQETVKAGADKIEGARAAGKAELDERMASMELATLSTVQKGLAEQVRGLSADEKLKEYDVIIWMNGQIVEYMETSRARMSKALTGKALASAQQTAIDRITDIINALKEEKEKKDPFAGGGGGGGGGGGKPPLVPPVAQLKLLKAMQMIVNNQTTTVDKSIGGASSEADKVELQGEASKLGKQQGEIKDMATKVMEKLGGGR